MSRDAKFILLILFVTFLHWWVMTQVRWPEGDFFHFAEKKPPEIEISEVPANGRKFVFSSKARDQDSEKKVAPFVGTQRNRVQKQTRSPFSGAFREGGGEPHPEDIPDAPPSPNGLSLKDLTQFGASPDDLPKDIDRGTDTVLNTDQMIYGSFFSRLYTQVYDAWRSALIEAGMAMAAADRRLEEGDHITELSLSLNQDGDVNSIRTIKSCGVLELDEACKRAFWRSGPFRDPPKKMASEDGFIHFDFGCNYRTNQIHLQL